MRITLTFIYFIITNLTLFAQGLSVELSVSWRRMEKHYINIPPIKSDSSQVVPFLKLVYRNLSGESIYFKGILKRDNDSYPPTALFGNICTEMDLADRAKNYLDYSGNIYNVFMCFGKTMGSCWDVLKTGIELSNEYEIDIINSDLFDIYEVLSTQQSLNELGIPKQLSCFTYPNKAVVSYMEAKSLISEEKEKTGSVKPLQFHFPIRPLKEEEIMETYSDQFVFLNPGEVYVQETNLIGFYLLGGSYEFSIVGRSLPGNVYGMNGQEIPLPKVVNGYQLYEKDFLTNTVKIEFDR